ncbi:hypothetical protein KSF_033070 [Reticulibacter mediterranei]|uniref:DUF1963 domain-containing protein n=1 Tax=Reticulibacter mediterranei TaxID=2778369 RepID=A0A8J3IKQ9_9CHLR|nr:hypothetical protein [Reticulibacter mediterranei]GHO93259.1 hypothetical protein KSF_033070 [Reticulibacter mediterranei]
MTMTRTTPPRPVDIAAVFPELAPLARTTTRLHPRPGNPTSWESSVGGPLLWPIDDPWPYCEEPHFHGESLKTLADVRLQRDMLTAAWKRPRQPGVNLLTPEEDAIIKRIQAGHSWTDEPIAMIPVAQLYARDIPDLHPPPGCDLLQVLWCPFGHDDENLPRVKLVWRSSSIVTSLLSNPPQPVAVESEDYVPEPCVVHPEQIIEYPALSDLDEALREQIKAWQEREKPIADVGSFAYSFGLSVAPGWKVGGWTSFSFRDAEPAICSCGTQMQPLLRIDSTEWDGGSGSWIPIEDQALNRNPDTSYTRPWEPVMVTIGRSYTMQIYTCPASVDHPPVAWMQ